MSTDAQIETEIQAKGLTAGPRVTPADVEMAIASEHYFTAGDGVTNQAMGFAMANNLDAIDRLTAALPVLNLLTFCVLVLRSGFTVTGENTCVSAQNFDPELGRRLAREAAVDKVWEFMGFELKERLYQLERAPHPLDRA